MVIKPRNIRKANNWVDLGDGTVKVELTQGFFTHLLKVDWEWLKAFRWYAMRIKQKTGKILVYAACSAWVNGKEKIIMMHRMIVDPEREQLVDHKNLDTLCNLRSNLRPCTRSQNLQNTGNQSKSASGEKNIYVRNGHYIILKMVGRKKYYFGRFKNLEDAIRQRDNVLRYLVGRFYRSTGNAFSTSGCAD